MGGVNDVGDVGGDDDSRAEGSRSEVNEGGRGTWGSPFDVHDGFKTCSVTWRAKSVPVLPQSSVRYAIGL